VSPGTLQQFSHRDDDWWGRIPESYHLAIRKVRCDGYEQTAKGSLGWRDALLAGVVPRADKRWPTDGVGNYLADTLTAIGLPRFCKQSPELTDQVVLWILQQANEASLRLADEIEQALRLKIEQEQRARDLESQEHTDAVAGLNPQGDLDKTEKKLTSARPIDSQEIYTWRQQISVGKLSEAKQSLHKDSRSEWSELIKEWTSIEEAFGAIGSFLGLGYDLSRSIFKMTGWKNVEKMHKLVAELPQIREIVQALGRMHAREDSLGEVEKVFTKVSRIIEERQQIEIPNARTETKGITQSADIPRMLPVESMLLRHPQFKKLWKARFIERSLATYKVTGFGEQVTKRTIEELLEVERRRKLERGPIILCLDTSGSMHGTPEYVAKAITLEAIRLAHAEKRRCMLYAFSGPADVHEQELNLDEKGLLQLIQFLSSSFHGGTDISAPMDKAIEKLSKDEWRRSDLIIVTDGEIPDDQVTARKVIKAKQDFGLRVHGLVIGLHSRGIMNNLCDPGLLHNFGSWQSVHV
jgi:uncharacterized protein with von Willebrand factor type A (vWA) domain